MPALATSRVGASLLLTPKQICRGSPNPQGINSSRSDYMSGGGYLNLYNNGNYSPRTETLTVYAVAVADDDDYSSVYADSDFASFNADEEAANGGERAEVRRLVFKLVETEVVYTAEPGGPEA